jgi:hypothetical protein
VIVSGEVKDSVQNHPPHLIVHAVAEFAGVSLYDRAADHEVSQVSAAGVVGFSVLESQDVRCTPLVSIPGVELGRPPLAADHDSNGARDFQRSKEIQGETDERFRLDLRAA